uniref:Methyltransferase small domain-containing protein n=2 Tax=Guillardia theta TaxID=55529 RepID=A0A6U6DF57_GUITH|mmetsp:Transcript_5775/g.20448  ORF Transcript_5775/g.20448 Transcript_5775/m.20448 type:complete len:148 (+) Transcript_5775:580-1023(+)
MQEETSRIENDPADTGITVWDGTMALARLFCSNPSIVQGKNILELGSGTGLLGCICSRLDCETMIMTDLKQVLPRLHVASKINCRGRNVVVKTLEWGKSTDEDHIMDTLENIAPDVIICSDIVYHESAVESIVQTLKRFHHALWGKN